jgi:two-component system response regulator (stage 0 sporulation protein F)
MNKNPKVLYVDDEQINLMMFEISFAEKFDLVTASNGMEGLKILENGPTINVVVSDLKMPGLDGIEFIKKAKERFPRKKYFLLTGFEMTPDIQLSLDSGLIHKCMRKPFNKKEIETEIEKYTK